MLNSADLVGRFVVEGVRVGSGIFVPGHGTVLNYPGRFTAAQIEILLAEGYTFVASNAEAPVVSVHSYESSLPPVVPDHLADERFTDWAGTLEPSADILANNSSNTLVDEPITVVETVTESVAVKKAVTAKNVR